MCQIICMLLLQFVWICPWYTPSILHIVYIFFGWTASLSTGTLHVIVTSWGQRKKPSFLKPMVSMCYSRQVWNNLELYYNEPVPCWIPQNISNDSRKHCLKTIWTVSSVRKLICGSKYFFGILPRRC